MSTKRETPGPGQESVWDYPRPPRVEDVSEVVRVEFNGQVIARTTRAKRVLETSHPPTYYIPPEDVDLSVLRPANGHTFCEFKGEASYFDLHVDGAVARHAAWSYPEPSGGYDQLKNHLCFFASKADCYVGDERARAQAGDFYGGWITSRVVGPFKGAPGTTGW